MTPQDFKALLESLNRIGTALEAKSGSCEFEAEL